MTLPQAFELALQHHQSGRLAEAEALYRQLLAVEPRHADALHLLGVIAHQVGRHDVAVDLIGQAIAVVPGVPNFHANLGIALRESGKLDEAMAAYRRAIALQPDFPEAHVNLGVALRDRGQLDEAIVAFRQAIALQPDFPEAHGNLGNALRQRGQLDEAIAAFRRAIAIKPGYAEGHNDLGNALFAKGQLDEAVAACRQAIGLRPGYPDAHCNLGAALYRTGQLDLAVAAFRQAIALEPSLAEAHSNLGNALRDQGQLDEAIAACRQAIALKPHFPEAHTNLGNALCDNAQLGEAAAAFRRAIELAPALAMAHNSLGNAFKEGGQLDEAIACYRAASNLQPDHAGMHSNLIYTLHYHPGDDAQAIVAEHRRWSHQHAEPLRHLIQPHGNDRTPARRLRIGYVSPDFRNHAVAFFLESLLASHDPAQVEVFCYADVHRPDAVTARLQPHAAHWRSILGLPDAQVAELIRQDGIDLLVDLAGHTAHNRLPLFARKPAPVQVTWLGYPDTTGLETMDYRLTDALADPPGTTEHLHTEQLVRLPDGAWCFRPRADAPAVSAGPVARTGHITFGCFNAQPKITAPLLQLWGELLRGVPGSRLFLKNRSLSDAATQQRLRAVLADAGLAPERLELAGYAPQPDEHLAAYGRVDIALDTFPYHGTTTTCEALWMGVPVVTLAGKTHASRVGVSLLSRVGLAKLIAESPADYVRLATALAHDLPRLAELRRTLRPRMAASPLTDAPRFARAIEAAYRAMWRAWCEQQPSHFPAP